MAAFFNFFKRQINKEWDLIMYEKFTNFNDVKIGQNQYATLHVEYSELDDFRFLELTVVGNLHVKTFKGTVISFQSLSSVIAIKSDTEEIHTDFSSELQKGITLIEMEVTPILIEFLTKETLDKITFEFENQKFTFQLTAPDIILEKIKTLNQS